MLRLFAPLFVFPILFSSCKKDSEVNIEHENASELLTKDAILKKVRLLSEKKSFSEKDVISGYSRRLVAQLVACMRLLLLDLLKSSIVIIVYMNEAN